MKKKYIYLIKLLIFLKSIKRYSVIKLHISLRAYFDAISKEQLKYKYFNDKRKTNTINNAMQPI